MNNITNYERLVTKLAAGERVDSAEIDRVLIRSGRTNGDLGRDVAASKMELQIR